MAPPLNRPQVDVARVVQALFALAAAAGLAVDKFEEPVQAAIAAVATVVYLVLEALRRGSVTPVADPRAADGRPLTPVGPPPLGK